MKTRTKGEMGAAKTLCSPFDQPELPEGMISSEFSLIADFTSLIPKIVLRTFIICYSIIRANLPKGLLYSRTQHSLSVDCFSFFLFLVFSHSVDCFRKERNFIDKTPK